MHRRKGRPAPRWLVMLEEIRAQGRAILEAVEASRVALAERIERYEQKTAIATAAFEQDFDSLNAKIATHGRRPQS